MGNINAVPVIRGDGEGERLSFYGGGLMTLKATNEETGGEFLLFEDVMAGGKATPLHIHDGQDETFYVLEGQILVHVDGKEHSVGQYGTAMVPRGVPHAFLVVSQSARLLTLLTPGDAEPFYRMASQPVEPGTEPSGAVDMDKVIDAAKKTGVMRVVGPPPFNL